VVLNRASEAMDDCEVASVTPLGHRGGHLSEIVTLISITHDDEAPASFFDALSQGITVAFDRGVDHTRAVRLGDLDRTVGGSIVGDDDFSADSTFTECGYGLVHADGNGASFIQARNHNGNVDRF